MLDLFESQSENLLIDDGEIDFLTPKDVADLMHISVVSARTLFHRADFPSIRVGTNFKVMKSAFINWCNQKRE